MNRARNNRREQIPTERPRFLNDPTGFWAEVEASNKALWDEVLPASTLFQFDQNLAATILQNLVKFRPSRARWDGVEFVCSLADSQATMLLDIGGTDADGAVTIIFSKSDPVFNGNAWPTNNNEIQLLVANKWKTFQISGVSGEVDQMDDAVIAVLKPETER